MEANRTYFFLVSRKTAGHRPGLFAILGMMPATFSSEAICAPSSCFKLDTGEKPSNAILMRCSRASSCGSQNEFRANLPDHPKDTNQNLPQTCLTQAVADARHGCSGQRRELVACAHQVAQSGVDCVNRTAIVAAIGGHEEARQSRPQALVAGEHLEHVDRRHFQR